MEANYKQQSVLRARSETANTEDFLKAASPYNLV